MKINILEIIESYAAKISPSKDRKELAEQRLLVCENCEHLIGETEITRRCGKCGCFVSGKVFTPHEGACPDGRWNDLDLKYFNEHLVKVLKKKGTRKLI